MSDDTTPSEHSGESSTPGASPAGASRSDATAGDAGSPQQPRGFMRRHKILLAIGVLLVIVASSAGGYYYWANSKLSAIPRVDAGILTEPSKNGGGEKHQDLNILLLGADHGAQSVAADLKDGKWTPFVHRSDTIMIAHIPADRRSVQLISIPRDTWTPINGYPYDKGNGKINAAFAYGGPALAVKTAQQITGMTIDHLAIIDWAGFKDLTTALGGVRVYIPQTFYDDSQRITWKQGWQSLEGEKALQYVRTRHGLANGDFDRIARQQNFMRATMGKLLSSTKNVVAMTKVINSITKYLTIDKTWDNGEIRNLALSMMGVKSADVTFLTAPLGKYDMVNGQSIVRLAPKQSKQLFADVDGDNIQHYLDKYPASKLASDKSVN